MIPAWMLAFALLLLPIMALLGAWLYHRGQARKPPIALPSRQADVSGGDEPVRPTKTRTPI